MTGYKSKRSAAQDKVTDIDGHVVRDVRKPRKLSQRPWVDHEPDGRMATQKFIEAENKKVSERYGYVPKLHPSEWQDKLAQPAQNSNWAWVCNECGAQEFTAALSEADLDYLACSNCGGDEFHKEALAQPVQEPVAWMVYTLDGASVCVTDNSADFTPEHRALPLYTAPPQRSWVDLTDDEWFEWWRVSPIADETEAEIDFADFLIIAQAVVAKLKEKNNGT